jgi:hypothetical protein
VFGGLGSLMAYRPYFIALAVASLGWTFYRHFRTRVSIARSRGAGAVLAEFKPRTGKDYRLYLGAAAVVVIMTFPQWGRPLLAKPAKPGAVENPRAEGNPCAPRNPCSK